MSGRFFGETALQPGTRESTTSFSPRPPTDMSSGLPMTADSSLKLTTNMEGGPSPWRTADRDLFASLPLTPRGSLPSISVAELASSVGSCDPEGSATFVDHFSTARRRWNTPSWKSVQSERGRARKAQRGFARSRHWSSTANMPHAPLTVAEVCALLQQHGLGHHVASFRVNKVDGRILPKLTENLLKRLGMHGAEDRATLMRLRTDWLKEGRQRTQLVSSATSLASQTARSDRERYLPSDPMYSEYHEVQLPKSWLRRWNSFDYSSGWVHLLERAARHDDESTDEVQDVLDELQPEVLVAMPGRLAFRPAVVHKEQHAEAKVRYASIRRWCNAEKIRRCAEIRPGAVSTTLGRQDEPLHTTDDMSATNEIIGGPLELKLESAEPKEPSVQRNTRRLDRGGRSVRVSPPLGV